jgi:bifunctional UDP-N-acetylglucosamine pyrophosphorylase/glucosamine-1-phosphate N-acetyltransferase
MEAGVTMLDPLSTYIEDTVEIGPDTVILPNTHLWGQTRVGAACTLGPNTVVRDTTIGDRCRVEASVLEGATLEDDVVIGPFAHLRPGAHLARGVHMGNFGEVKNSYLGPGTKMGHFSYLGDATLGENVNVGAGTITCNFDGASKHRTVIEDEVFIGSDSQLVAPVRVRRGAFVGAGSTITKDVPAHALAIARGRQLVKDGWARRFGPAARGRDGDGAKGGGKRR